MTTPNSASNTLQKSPKKPAHSRQAWRIAICGVLALGVALGIGRFAFSPLLPMMLSDQIVDLTQGGWLATGNYVGYFLGAMLCMILRGKPVFYIRLGLILTIALTLGMSLCTNVIALLLFRTLAGIASALVFVFTSGWCMQRLTQLGSPTLAGMIYIGPGLGILASGIPVTFMVAANWHSQSGWMTFTVMSFAVAALIWSTFSLPPVAAPTLNSAQPATQLIAANLSDKERRFETNWLIVGYGLAGLGYIITATFLPVMAKNALPTSIWSALFWPILGVSIAIGSAATAKVPMHSDNRLMMMWCYLMQAVGVVCVIVLPNIAGFILSSIFVGLPFSAIVLFAMRDARRLKGDAASSLMGLLTAIYGIGQISGPPIATYLVTLTGSFTPSLLVAAGALLLGAILFAVMVKRTRQRTR